MSVGSHAPRTDYISKYRRVLDHFDAVRIGLTATPALHTTAIFGTSVFQYTYRQPAVDDALVDHEPPYRLVTKLAEEGMRWERGATMKIYDTHANALQQFNTPDEVEIEVVDFNRKVITENFNRTICQANAAATDADGSAVDQGLADSLRGLQKQATWN